MRSVFFDKSNIKFCDFQNGYYYKLTQTIHLPLESEQFVKRLHFLFPKLRYENKYLNWFKV